MYLTGVAQPHTVAVFGGPDSPAPGYTLFVPDPDNHVGLYSCCPGPPLCTRSLEC